jgi:hypothetical protein
MATRHFLPLLAAACVGATISYPFPAQAGVSAAAWSVASIFCTGLKAGLSRADAVRVAMRDNRPLWSSEMGDPAFERMFLAQVMQQCPAQLIDAATQ